MISILIPSRSGNYLYKTVEDILAHFETPIEILVGFDGCRPFILPEDERVRVFHKKNSIGQRAMMNLLAKESLGNYILKTDSHCSFASGVDTTLLETMQDDWIVAPYMLVLDAEKWTIRQDKKSSAYIFKDDYIFNYGVENMEPINETMCLQGSFFLVKKDNYFNWNLCDESLGSWGSQGVELGIKAFLNGGKCMTNKMTYYGHMFKTDEKDFLYNRGENPGKHSNELLRKLYPKDTLLPLFERYMV